MTAGRRPRWRERAASARRRVRPRRVITATGLAGAGLLAASLSVRAGSRQFYLLTTALACTWAGGARAAGPLPRARTQTTATCRAALRSCPC